MRRRTLTVAQWDFEKLLVPAQFGVSHTQYSGGSKHLPFNELVSRPINIENHFKLSPCLEYYLYSTWYRSTQIMHLEYNHF